MSQQTGPRLEMRQGQSLVMTQQLQTSIKLLQLTSIELSEFLEEELEKNPLLALEGGDETMRNETQPEEAMAENENAAAEQNEAQGEEWEENSEDRSVDMDESGWEGEESFAGDYEPDYGVKESSGASDDSKRQFIENSSEEKSLREHLSDQMQAVIEEGQKRMVAAHLIDLVYDAGYITEDLDKLAADLDCEKALLQEALVLLQTFDPPGVCARNLKECLAIQLKEKDRFDPAMQKLLENLEKLARGEMEALQKICGVDAEDLQEMVTEIRALNPKPGQAFSSEVSQVVIPDVLLKKNKLGDYIVELNQEALPRLLINRTYHAQLLKSELGKQEKKYLTDQLNTANWLIKALDQRAQTILKVTTEIVSQQEEFFRKGIRYLKPMTLKDIAGPVGLHESTVSRVTSNKFLSTARGTYKLKDFFTSSLTSASGEDVSSRSVQQMIRELVDAESAGDILSDDVIAGKLQDKGIDVARRTVAKYREEMKIPSSVQRRREKASRR